MGEDFDSMSTVTGPGLSPAFELAPYKSLDNETLAVRINAVRAEMGSRLLVLGHHYQQDEVIDIVLGMEEIDDMARLARALQAR